MQKLGGNRGFIDLFWPGELLVEQKSVGRDLNRAKQQAFDYFPGIKEAELPRRLLLSDFQTFILIDLDKDEREKGREVRFSLPNLRDNVESFGFIVGVTPREFRDQDPVNIQAAEIMGTLHDALKAQGYTGHDLERLLVRLLFCLFADDTGIFEPNTFWDLIRDRTGEDGADIGGRLIELFQTLNKPEKQRQDNLDENLAEFPYVNGDLFEGSLETPAFNRDMREKLLTACAFNWSKISPAIFGSLFQSVMDPKARRSQGAHYTTEQNIRKVIQPLFLDDLHAEFKALKSRKGDGRIAALRRFHKRLGEMTFFDPACGCGNFLIIAYRELRLLEMEVIQELLAPKRNAKGEITGALDVSDLSQLDVDQFHGIEIGEFPVRIAETALWMMDHIMNDKLSRKFGFNYIRIPLKKSPHIVHGDALEMDWASVLPAEKCSYVFGNPPFGGSKLQTPIQRAQVRRIADLGGTGGTLDYVSAWFIKAGDYAKSTALIGKAPPIGFVATNSITQGEQVSQIWPLLLGERCRLEISFAHRTFAWGSDARGKAHVHVVIIGLVKAEDAPKTKRLFSHPDIKGESVETNHKSITPYLFDGERLSNPHLTVRESPRPLNGLPRLVMGSKPIDKGNYIFTDEEKAEFLAAEPGAAKFLRPYIGAAEYIKGSRRWILALHDASPAELRALPKVRERIRAVREYRKNSTSVATRKLAETPTLYHLNVIPDEPFLIIPGVSSERRDYVPIGRLEPPAIPSNATFAATNTTPSSFALLTSAMHMAWLSHIGGRLGNEYRYSIGVVYNTFPVPPLSKTLLEKALTEPAQKVLDARAAYPDSSLADLYDPDTMPPDLRKAHSRLDAVVDRLYRRSGFDSERARAEFLLGLYEKTLSPLKAGRRKGQKW